MSDIHTIGHRATGIGKQPDEYILADSKTSCITEFRNEVHEAVPSMGIVYGKAEAFLKLNTH